MTGAVPEGADTPRYAEVRAYAGTPAHADDTHEPIVLSSLLRQESSAQALMAPAAPLQEIQGYELPGAQESDSGWPEDTVAEAPVAPEAGAEGAPTPLPQEPTAAASENSDEQPAQAEQPDLQVLERENLRLNRELNWLRADPAAIKDWIKAERQLQKQQDDFDPWF